ncbi:MAG: Uma2 family endonuclease [Bacteroidota bacterium]
MDTLNLDLNKRYTYADYLTWVDDKRRELINGVVNLMTPAPARQHQKISGEIFTAFNIFLRKKKCEVYSAPFDVRLPKKGEKSDDKICNVVQPDITVICNPDKLDDKGCIGAPDLIVEILSPATRRKDLKDKYKLYEQSGVKEYWIVYPNEKIIYQYVLNNKNKYEQKDIYTDDDKISPNIFPDLTIEFNDIFDK